MLRFISFALVGGIGTAAHYAVLFSLVEGLSWSPVLASGLGSVAGLMLNYTLNFKYTFTSQQSHQQTLPKYIGIAAVGMLFNLALMEILCRHWYYAYAQIVTTILVLFWNFFGNRFWTFRMDQRQQPAIAQWRIASEQRAVWLLPLTVLALRLLSMGFYPLYDPSESRYAEMARKMLASGNWVTPMIDYGVPFWGKPPLTLWLSAISMQIGGVNDFSVRLPSLLLSVGMALLVFHLATKQSGKSGGWHALLIVCSSVLFYVMSGTVAMDLGLSFGVTLALTAFWRALNTGRSSWGYVFFIGLSVGVMAKGPVALVLSGICIFLWTLCSNQWLLIWRRIPWISGTLLMLALCIPWFWLAEQHTPGFLEYFFIGEHWKRFTESGWKGDLYGIGRSQPRGMIWLYWLLGSFPWSLVLLYRFFPALYRKQWPTLFASNDHWRLYCACWMLAPLLFFSLSANIIWTYVLPGLPGMALLLASWRDRHKSPALLALLVPVAFAGVVTYYQLAKAEFFKSQKPIVTAYRQLAATDEQLVYLKEKIYSAQFYMQGQVTEVEGIAALQQHLQQHARDYYVIRDAIAAELPTTIKDRLQVAAHYGQFSLYHAHAPD